MKQILAVGADPALLYTRALVLERSGNQVNSASPDSALLLLSIREFDLVVLCHSLSENELQHVVFVARAAVHPAITLLIERPADLPKAHVSVDHRFPLEEGPELLVARVRELLKQSTVGAVAPLTTSQGAQRSMVKRPTSFGFAHASVPSRQASTARVEGIR